MIRPPIFGLSTTPIMDVKSELQQSIERAQIIIYNRSK